MYCRPAIPLDAPADRPKVSVILIDWKARESFHALHYLNRQTAPRTDYELIWVEFYDHRPEGLRRAIAEHLGPRPLLDRWVTLGYPDEAVYHKHRMYNVGLLAARGQVCVICDSDAMFAPTFIRRLIREFEADPDGVFHVDQVRSRCRDHYPFNYPSTDDVIRHAYNWEGGTTCGLNSSRDWVHRANYGACLAARRRDLLAVGGADEHLDYLGYYCGPFDMTFRLANHRARGETWLRDEYLYHTWHPNTSGENTEYAGPEDGKFMPLRALDARARCRIAPHRRSPLLPGWPGRTPTLEAGLDLLARTPEPQWRRGVQPAGHPDDVYWVEKNHNGHNLFWHKGRWYGLPLSAGEYDPRRPAASRVEADTQDELEEKIAALPAGEMSRLMVGFHTHPVSRWPSRLWRRARNGLRAAFPPSAPWPA
ncbi:MAG: glycosyltransferase [Gemmataceae bacterium]